MGDDKVHFLSRTHGGMAYGWEGDKPRFVWHTDDIYARGGRICFPIDEKTGELVPKGEADQRYFGAVWLAPDDGSSAALPASCRTCFPTRYGHDSNAPDEDRWEFGTVSGYWTAMNRARQDELLDWSQDYAFCGEPLLQLAASRAVTAQLTINFKAERGKLSAGDPPALPTLKEFEARAAAGLRAVGGADKLKTLVGEAESAAGK